MSRARSSVAGLTIEMDLYDCKTNERRTYIIYVEQHRHHLFRRPGDEQKHRWHPLSSLTHGKEGKRQHPHHSPIHTIFYYVLLLYNYFTPDRKCASSMPCQKTDMPWGHVSKKCTVVVEEEEDDAAEAIAVAGVVGVSAMLLFLLHHLFRCFWRC